MREIKFRAWDKFIARMLPEPTIGHGYLNKRLSEEGSYIWMQYTGLKDKSGKEIYEGDICRFYEEKEEPTFFHGLAFMNNDNVGGSWKIIKCENEGGEESLDSSSFWNDNFEVIGNIYENPELLTKKDS